MTTRAALEVESVVKRYGDHLALDGISLVVEPGEVCGLLGPNGAGKTTLVSIVAGLRAPDAGRVTVAGMDMATDGRNAREQVGLAAQETGIYPTVTVRDNLVLFADLAGYRNPARDQRVEEVADVLELTEFLPRLARHLSGGEKRRLHTAMALIHRPRVLLLDEPTTGVDVGTRARLLAAVTTLAAEDGTAVVYSTHYLPEIEALGATVAILDRGQLLARGSLTDLVTTHGSGALEVTFDGDAPHLSDFPAEVDGPVLRLTTDEPSAVMGSIIGQLGGHADRVLSVDLKRPSLESVFMKLTGRRYSADDETAGVGSSQ